MTRMTTPLVLVVALLIPCPGCRTQSDEGASWQPVLQGEQLVEQAGFEAGLFPLVQIEPDIGTDGVWLLQPDPPRVALWDVHEQALVRTMELAPPQSDDEVAWGAAAFDVGPAGTLHVVWSCRDDAHDILYGNPRGLVRHALVTYDREGQPLASVVMTHPYTDNPLSVMRVTVLPDGKVALLWMGFVVGSQPVSVELRSSDGGVLHRTEPRYESALWLAGVDEATGGALLSDSAQDAADDSIMVQVLGPSGSINTLTRASGDYLVGADRGGALYTFVRNRDDGLPGYRLLRFTREGERSGTIKFPEERPNTLMYGVAICRTGSALAWCAEEDSLTVWRFNLKGMEP